MTETIEVLKAARELISDPAHWTQGVFARDVLGKVTRLEDREACQFCAVGALAKNLDGRFIGELPYSLLKAMGFEDSWHITSFNDSHTHKAVLTRFDAAIAKAEGRA